MMLQKLASFNEYFLGEKGEVTISDMIWFYGIPAIIVTWVLLLTISVN